MNWRVLEWSECESLRSSRRRFSVVRWLGMMPISGFPRPERYQPCNRAQIEPQRPPGTLCITVNRPLLAPPLDFKMKLGDISYSCSRYVAAASSYRSLCSHMLGIRDTNLPSIESKPSGGYKQEPIEADEPLAPCARRRGTTRNWSKAQARPLLLFCCGYAEPHARGRYLREMERQSKEGLHFVHRIIFIVCFRLLEQPMLLEAEISKQRFARDYTAIRCLPTDLGSAKGRTVSRHVQIGGF